jgi:glutaconate CoA-transferase subunit A
MNTRRRERIIDEVDAASWIESGMTIAIGMPTPYAVVRQIIRRGLKDLTVVDSGFSLDLLIGAGCVRKVLSYYAGGGFGNPVTPMFRRAAERGEIEVWECEEGILCAGLQAARRCCRSCRGAAASALRYPTSTPTSRSSRIRFAAKR